MNDTRPARFRDLHHRAGGFIMPNAWDAGSAVMIAAQGFDAIATTSAGIAFALGKPDYQVGASGRAVSRDEMIAAIGRIAAAVTVPVNADLESGYGDTPAAVAETVSMAIDAGAAGGNIEDVAPDGSLIPLPAMIERVAAVRAMLDAGGSRFVLTARTDIVGMQGRAAMAEGIARANSMLAAGADCVFLPGVNDTSGATELVAAIDGPINLVLGLGGATGNARDLLAAGIQRISVGGSIARATYGLMRDACHELKTAGTVTYASGQVPQPELNALFSAANG